MLFLGEMVTVKSQRRGSDGLKMEELERMQANPPNMFLSAKDAPAVVGVDAGTMP